mmetsp:Transcript_33219/g.98735  ORF Transcript_33219/g.98735 Transcript_33219/m.98735 type:complete len:321 (+) Transcript_33219:352-1314(+)
MPLLGGEIPGYLLARRRVPPHRAAGRHVRRRTALTVVGASEGTHLLGGGLIQVGPQEAVGGAGQITLQRGMSLLQTSRQFPRLFAHSLLGRIPHLFLSRTYIVRMTYHETQAEQSDAPQSAHVQPRQKSRPQNRRIVLRLSVGVLPRVEDVISPEGEVRRDEGERTPEQTAGDVVTDGHAGIAQRRIGHPQFDLPRRHAPLHQRQTDGVLELPQHVPDHALALVHAVHDGRRDDYSRQPYAHEVHPVGQRIAQFAPDEDQENVAHQYEDVDYARLSLGEISAKIAEVYGTEEEERIIRTGQRTQYPDHAGQLTTSERTAD